MRRRVNVGQDFEGKIDVIDEIKFADKIRLVEANIRAQKERVRSWYCLDPVYCRWCVALGSCCTRALR